MIDHHLGENKEFKLKHIKPNICQLKTDLLPHIDMESKRQQSKIVGNMKEFGGGVGKGMIISKLIDDLLCI